MSDSSVVCGGGHDLPFKSNGSLRAAMRSLIDDPADSALPDDVLLLQALTDFEGKQSELHDACGAHCCSPLYHLPVTADLTPASYPMLGGAHAEHTLQHQHQQQLSPLLLPAQLLQLQLLQQGLQQEVQLQLQPQPSKEVYSQLFPQHLANQEGLIPPHMLPVQQDMQQQSMIEQRLVQQGQLLPSVQPGCFHHQQKPLLELPQQQQQQKPCEVLPWEPPPFIDGLGVVSPAAAIPQPLRVAAAADCSASVVEPPSQPDDVLMGWWQMMEYCTKHDMCALRIWQSQESSRCQQMVPTPGGGCCWIAPKVSLPVKLLKDLWSSGNLTTGGQQCKVLNFIGPAELRIFGHQNMSITGGQKQRYARPLQPCHQQPIVNTMHMGQKPDDNGVEGAAELYIIDKYTYIATKPLESPVDKVMLAEFVGSANKDEYEAWTKSNMKRKGQLESLKASHCAAGKLESKSLGWETGIFKHETHDGAYVRLKWKPWWPALYSVKAPTCRKKFSSGSGMDAAAATSREHHPWPSQASPAEAPVCTAAIASSRASIGWAQTAVARAGQENHAGWLPPVMAADQQPPPHEAVKVTPGFLPIWGAQLQADEQLQPITDHHLVSSSMPADAGQQPAPQLPSTVATELAQLQLQLTASHDSMLQPLSQWTYPYLAGPSAADQARVGMAPWPHGHEVTDFSAATVQGSMPPSGLMLATVVQPARQHQSVLLQAMEAHTEEACFSQSTNSNGAVLTDPNTNSASCWQQQRPVGSSGGMTVVAGGAMAGTQSYITQSHSVRVHNAEKPDGPTVDYPAASKVSHEAGGKRAAVESQPAPAAVTGFDLPGSVASYGGMLQAACSRSRDGTTEATGMDAAADGGTLPRHTADTLNMPVPCGKRLTNSHKVELSNEASRHRVQLAVESMELYFKAGLRREDWRPMLRGALDSLGHVSDLVRLRDFHKDGYGLFNILLHVAVKLLKFELTGSDDKVGNSSAGGAMAAAASPAIVTTATAAAGGEDEAGSGSHGSSSSSSLVKQTLEDLVVQAYELVLEWIKEKTDVDPVITCRMLLTQQDMDALDTPSHTCARFNLLVVQRWLLERCDASMLLAATKDGWLPLATACRSGHIEAAAAYLGRARQLRLLDEGSEFRRIILADLTCFNKYYRRAKGRAILDQAIRVVWPDGGGPAVYEGFHDASSLKSDVERRLGELQQGMKGLQLDCCSPR